MLCVSDWIRHNARRFPGKVALVDGEQRMTYAQLDQDSDGIAAALAVRGVRHGDRVAILAGASAEWVRAYLGIIKAGAIAAALNYRETGRAIGQMLAASGASLLFVDDARRSLLTGIDGVPDQLELSAPALDALAAGGGRPEVAQSPADVNVILFTGGTTGASKGVPLTHANLWWNAVNQILDTRMTEWDTTLLATALHHSAALNTWLLPHLYLGATAVVLREFTPGHWLEAMQRERATNSFTPPTMARTIVRHAGADRADWSGFRRWYSGAGILPRHEREEMAALCPGLGIYYEYGLTEAGPIVTVLQPEDFARAPASIGRAVRHCEMRILRPDRSDAPAGEVGEIAVRGPAVMAGYWQRPDETARVFHSDVRKGGGWLLTGDLAAMDEHGFATFSDRSKDLIKSGGMNIYSHEVEHVIGQHPAVREVAVVGVTDEVWGEMVTAVITLHDGREASEAELIAHARARLGGYQTPKRVIFMSYDEVPKNYLGKILKRELRERLKQA